MAEMRLLGMCYDIKMVKLPDLSYIGNTSCSSPTKKNTTSYEIDHCGGGVWGAGEGGGAVWVVENGISNGLDEKSCLPSTMKKAVVNVDHNNLPFSTGRRRPLPFSAGRHLPSCLFLVVDVDLPFSTCLFRVVDVNLPFSTTGRRRPYLVNFFWRSCLFLVNLPFSTCLFLVVDVDPPFSTCLFLLVDVDLPFSSCFFLLVDIDLPFSNWSTCLFLTGWKSASVNTHQRAFYSPFHSALSNTRRFKGFKFVHLERNGSKVYITVFR